MAILTVASIEHHSVEGVNSKTVEFYSVTLTKSLFSTALPTVLTVFQTRNKGLFDFLNKFPRNGELVDLSSDEWRQACTEDPSLPYWHTDMYAVKDNKIFYEEGCVVLETVTTRIDLQKEGDPQRYFVTERGEMVKRQNGQLVVETHCRVTIEWIADELGNLILSDNSSSKEEFITNVVYSRISEGKYIPCIVDDVDDEKEEENKVKEI